HTNALQRLEIVRHLKPLGTRHFRTVAGEQKHPATINTPDCVIRGARADQTGVAYEMIVCPVFSQSATNCRRPMSVKGCLTSDCSTAGGTVTTSAPIIAACLTWFTLR